MAIQAKHDKQAKRQRREALDCCDWRFWQEMLMDSEGRPVDETGKPLPGRKPTPIMVWREKGKPCDACWEIEFRAVTNRCAEGKCKSGRNCPKHRHRYETAPCYGCGHYHKHGSNCGCKDGPNACGCQAIEPWPASYPLPESATNKGGEGRRKAIRAYHRGTDGQVALRQQQQEEEATILPMQGAEAERYWGSLNQRLAALAKPEALTAMARRCLTRQQEQGRRADAFGEGLGGVITLDVDAESQLAELIRQQEAEQAAEKLRAEKRKQLEEDDYSDVMDEDEQEDEPIIRHPWRTGRRTSQRDDEEDDDIDMDYLIRGE